MIIITIHIAIIITAHVDKWMMELKKNINLKEIGIFNVILFFYCSSETS